MTNIVFISHYLPPAYKAGGPISVARTLLETPCVANKMTFLGSCEDSGGEQLSRSALNSHDGKYNTLKRCKTTKDVWDFLFKNKEDISLIYINSLFDPQYAILPLIFSVMFNKAVVISPRGELHPPALGYKSFKKFIYLCILRALKYWKRLEWIVTNQEERSYVLQNKLGTKSNIHIFNDPIPFINEVGEPSYGHNELPIVLTCGRISPIKNHHFVLEVLQDIDIPVVWRILGTTEDSALFRDLMIKAKSSTNITVEYLGARPYVEVMQIMRECTVLFNPSLSENFGYVFLEAFANGLPVITTNGTPWKELEQKGIGGNFDLKDKASFRRALAKAIKDNRSSETVKQCRRYYEEIAKEYSPQSLLDHLLKIQSFQQKRR